MSKKLKDVLKKGVAPKSTFGTNPMDPWSTKAGLSEGALETYLSSKGIDPKFVSTDTKIAHAKSAAFLKWKSDHKTEEVVHEDMTTKSSGESRSKDAHSPTLQRQSALNKANKHYLLKPVTTHNPVKKEASQTTSIMPEHIVKSGSGYKLLSKKTGKSLGTAKTKAGIEKRERQVQFFKHRNEELDPNCKVALVPVDESRGHKIIATKLSSLERWRNSSFDRDVEAKKRDDEMKARHAAGKEDMKGAIDRLAKTLNKEEVVNEMDKSQKASGRAADYPLGVKGVTVKPSDVKKVQKDTLSILQKAFKQAKAGKLKSDGRKPGDNWTGPKPGEGAHAAGHGMTAVSMKKIEEDVGDAKAATNADGLHNGQLEPVSEKKRQMSKSARMIKALYKSKRMVKEDLYDHEKEDKSVATYGKKPKFEKADKEESKGEKKPQAAAVMSGGTTLTGEKRDDVEIDPIMRNRPGQPDVTKKDDKKKDDKKEDNKKDK